MKGVVIVAGGVIFLFLLFYYRYKRALCKVWSYTPCERVQLIDELLSPFGFCYEPVRDLIVSRKDAWQRMFGYEWNFDKHASRFHMIFQCVPVYFDYGGKSWLIEFWKGQYGISQGAEIGIYSVPYLVPKDKRKKTHYQCASDEECANLAFAFYEDGKHQYTYGDWHWWLASFRIGSYNCPERLRLKIRICFGNKEMALAFAQAVMEQYHLITGIEKNGICVVLNITNENAMPPSRIRHIANAIRMRENQILAKVYLRITRPFVKQADCLLFLYWQLPFLFRHVLWLKPFNPKICKDWRRMCRGCTKNIG